MSRLTGRDALGIGAVLALVAIVLARFYEWRAAPFEDAAMLMRYAQHLAEGNGVVWNVGEPPIDGATDFLFMVAIAALHGVGMSLLAATQTLVIGAHLATVALVYGRTRASGFGAGAATAAAAFLAVGPGLAYAEAYFGTPFFAFWSALTWCGAIAYRDRPRTGVAVATAFAALGLGLTRPDGVLLAGLIYLGVAFQVDRRAALRLFAAFAAVFGTLGVAYFAWRWTYFGHPLPNPYYKKGGFHLWIGSLVTAIKAVVQFLLPLLPLYALSLRTRAATREALFSAVPVAGFTAVWILLSDEMNFLGRFQYAVVPIAVLSAPRLFAAVHEAWELPRWETFDRRSRGLLAVVAFMVAVVVPLALFRPSLGAGEDGRAAIGRALAPYADEGYVLATTEAGLLPLLSGWTSVDTWGLNDATIAHSETGITRAYLDERRPAVLLVHGSWTPVFEDPSVGAWLGPKWDAMCALLRDWATERGYTLAAAWGASHADSFAFWVDAENPDHDALVEIIRTTPFDTFGGPGVYADYARLSGTLSLPGAE